MEVKITSNAFSFAEVHMQAGDSIYANPGAMATMRGELDLSASISDALNPFKSMMRRAAQREVIMAKYTAKGPALLGLAPDVPGDMISLDVTHTGPLRIEAGALLAYEETVKIGTRVAGAGKVLMGNSLVGVRASGTGHVIVSAYGGMKSTTLQPGERMIVDSGHIVAWSDSAKMRIGPLGGILKSNLTGEGLVGQFEGPGTVLVQTRPRPDGKRRK